MSLVLSCQPLGSEELQPLPVAPEGRAPLAKGQLGCSAPALPAETRILNNANWCLSSSYHELTFTAANCQADTKEESWIWKCESSFPLSEISS